MMLTQTDLFQLKIWAKEAALLAGKHIQECFKNEIEVLHKNKGGSIASDVVTVVDLQAQQIIFTHLSKSISQYDLGWLGEESEDDGSRLVKDYFWTVDPIDGTLPFTNKKDGFSVAIGLVSKSGQAIVGVVYDPYDNHLYEAIQGDVAYKDGLPFLIQYHKQKGLTFYTDLSYTLTGHFPFFVQALERKSMTKYQLPLQIVKHKGAILNAIGVIENAPACYIKAPRSKQGGGSAWDFAASVCIFEAVGGKVTDYFGNPINLNKKENTFMNYEGIVFELL